MPGVDISILLFIGYIRLLITSTLFTIRV